MKTSFTETHNATSSTQDRVAATPKSPAQGWLRLDLRLNDYSKARAVAAEILKVNPRFSVEKVVERRPLNQVMKDRMRAALLKLGLSE